MPIRNPEAIRINFDGCLSWIIRIDNLFYNHFESETTQKSNSKNIPLRCNAKVTLLEEADKNAGK